jgi:hypothetical protein
MLSALLYSAVGAVFTWLLTIQCLRSELRQMERHYEIAVGSWKDRYAAAFNRVQELEKAIDAANYVRHWGNEDASDAN